MFLAWFPSPSQRSLLATGGAIALGLAASVSLQRPRLAALQRAPEEIPPAEYQRQVEQAALNLKLWQHAPAFGFDNLLADWIFLRYLQYFGDDEARAVTGYSLVLDYLRPVIRNDPRFRDAYLYLATSGALYAAQPEATDELMAWGLQFLQPQHPPYSYRVWRSRGVNQILFLGDAAAAQESFARAGAWAATYDDPEHQAIALDSLRTADFLATNPDSKQVQVYAWATVLRSVPDEATQQRAIEAIEALGGRVKRDEDGQFQVTPPKQD